jgi:ankyrin repeat protein
MSEELIEHIGNEHWEDALSMVQSDDSLLHTIDLEDLLWSKVSYHTNEFHKYSVENNLDKLQALENLIETCVGKGLKPKTVYSAAVLGDISLIEKMLQDGHFIDENGFGERTGLIIAALFDNYELCKYLVAHNAHAMFDDIEHFTAIDYTTSLEIIQLLKQAGAYTKAESDQMANDYADSMDFVNDLRDTQIEFMNGAEKGDVVQMEHALNKPKGYLVLNGTYPVNSKSALHLAVEKNKIESVNFLLSKGLDKNKKDINGESPIDIAKKLNLHEILQLLEKSDNKRE